ncbi:Putative peptidoglycan binding domain-containing protein [Shimia haliotis]|uniref:Putative peptidoglycan binding domain-containing protein n=1 Tax=Shimia haliotis TaxID=1280847 RepID=A0A1I4GM77_9RHOB|nr:Putative peptidoglycan binding domain-containing protein [Shimia haliotis]
MATLPSDKECEEVKDGTETLYLCDGVLYRATYYDDTQVYEIVSPAEEEAAEQAQTMIGLALTTPMTSGPAVRELQTLLVGYGYDVGTVDGVFGTATETALLWLQYDYELEQTGMVDEPTARLLGILPPDPEAEEGAAEEATTEPTEAASAEDEPEQEAADESADEEKSDD